MHQYPCDTFIHVFSDENIEQLYVRLEALHPSTMAAKTARDSTIKDATKVQAILDQHAVDMCKTSMFGCGVSVLIRFSKVQVPTSTLFSRSEDLRSGLEPLVEKARDYYPTAVSLYQGLEQCTEQTLEWCDILVDVLEVTRQRDLSNGSGVTEEQCATELGT